MSMRRHAVRAPSNIAIVKYMGKRDAVANLPDNPSLSMTLESLATWVSVEDRGEGGFVIEPGVPDGAPVRQAKAPVLSEAGRDKVLRHVERVRAEAARILPAHGLAYRGSLGLVLRTANTFPEASGIASSASSFAAVTLATALACAADPAAFRGAYATRMDLRRELARLSRRGSGSSCRSFEGPWVLWEAEDAGAVDVARMPELAHFVLLISSEAKAVSSSQAHARVKTSPLWQGRVERATQRVETLRTALACGDLPAISRLAWSEAWEMHSLFHTSDPPFSYWKPGTVDALEWLARFVCPPYSAHSAGAAFAPGGGSPPIVTMDAGPNIHVTVARSDAALWRERLQERFGAHALLEDRPGSGAEVVL